LETWSRGEERLYLICGCGELWQWLAGHNPTDDAQEYFTAASFLLFLLRPLLQTPAWIRLTRDAWRGEGRG
jgi:hypothetical protein